MLLLQWLTNGSAWFLLLLACRRAGLVNLRIDPSLFRRSLAFGVKAYVAQIFFYLVLRVDQVLVAHYAGYRQLGLYALATTVAELLWLLTDPLAGALMPHMVRARTGDDRRLSFSTARMSLMHFNNWAVGGGFLAPIVIPVVYGAGFAGAVPALRLLLPGVVALGAAKSLGSVLVKEGPDANHKRAGPQRTRPEHSPQHRAAAANRNSRREHCVVGCYAGAGAVVRGDFPAPGGGWVEDLVPRASDLALLGRKRLRRRARRSAGALRVAFVVGSLNRGGTEGQIIALASATHRARSPGDGDLS